MVNKSVSFTVDADVYEKFCIALNLTNETQDAAVEIFNRFIMYCRKNKLIFTFAMRMGRQEN